MHFIRMKTEKNEDSDARTGMQHSPPKRVVLNASETQMFYMLWLWRYRRDITSNHTDRCVVTAPMGFR